VNAGNILPSSRVRQLKAAGPPCLGGSFLSIGTKYFGAMKNVPVREFVTVYLLLEFSNLRGPRMLVATPYLSLT
jgi:hypothetical protein